MYALNKTKHFISLSPGVTEFKYERKNEKDSGHSSKKNDTIMQIAFSKDANLQRG